MCRFDTSPRDEDLLKLALGNVVDLYEEAFEAYKVRIHLSEPEQPQTDDQTLRSRFAALRNTQ